MKKLNLKNSIYANKLSNSGGLTVDKGRLVNHMPDGVSGIQKAVMIKGEKRRMDKVMKMAEAVNLGMTMKDMGCSDCG